MLILLILMMIDGDDSDDDDANYNTGEFLCIKSCSCMNTCCDVRDM